MPIDELKKYLNFFIINYQKKYMFKEYLLKTEIL